MKQYVWIAVVFLFTGVQASENPFDLGENLKKIDQDQDILLLELKKMSQKKEEQEEKVMNAQEGSEENRLEDNTMHNEENVSSDNEVVQKSETNLTVEEERLKKVKEEQEKIEQARVEHEALKKAQEQKIKEEAQAEEERLAEEKREVEKYEAQRLEKKKAEEKAAALLVKQVKEEKLVVKPIQEKVTETVKEDINLTREKVDAVEEAEKAYLEAIKEVNQED
jgi:hypothetical protein